MRGEDSPNRWATLTFGLTTWVCTVNRIYYHRHRTAPNYPQCADPQCSYHPPRRRISAQWLESVHGDIQLFSDHYHIRAHSSNEAHGTVWFALLKNQCTWWC